ncbi:hypothetical protein HG530_002028 [Fusarium avenaceum]|nr:hypothetical protein HG530_002028 [Fusarium avenaceum]
MISSVSSSSAFRPREAFAGGNFIHQLQESIPSLAVGTDVDRVFIASLNCDFLTLATVLSSFNARVAECMTTPGHFDGLVDLCATEVVEDVFRLGAGVATSRTIRPGSRHGTEALLLEAHVNIVAREEHVVDLPGNETLSNHIAWDREVAKVGVGVDGDLDTDSRVLGRFYNIAFAVHSRHKVHNNGRGLFQRLIVVGLQSGEGGGMGGERR